MIYFFASRGSSPSTYFTELKILWDELEDLHLIPSSICSNLCKSSLSTCVHTYKNTKYIICFLKGLNYNYNNVCNQILPMDPLPSISKAYSLLAQHDSVSPIESPSFDSNSIVVSWNHISRNKGFQGQNYVRGRGNKRPMLCTHCNKTNHTIENYYFKHGLFHGYKSKFHLDPWNIPTILLLMNTRLLNPIQRLLLANNMLIVPRLFLEMTSYSWWTYRKHPNKISLTENLTPISMLSLVLPS